MFISDGLNPFIAYLFKGSSDNTWIGTNNDGLFIPSGSGRVLHPLSMEDIVSNAVKSIRDEKTVLLYTNTVKPMYSYTIIQII